MATRKQAIEVIDKWLHETESDILEDKDLDIDAELMFFVEEYLNEYDLCWGCRWYFRPERSCEKPTDGIQCCINRMYNHWVETHKQGETTKEAKNEGHQT